MREVYRELGLLERLLGGRRRLNAELALAVRAQVPAASFGRKRGFEVGGGNAFLAAFH